jgi:tRNA 5-methylaminomethyl-2-thiouridine biosynthesis bifunctional protein
MTYSRDWDRQAIWRILATDFGTGLDFLTCWQTWKNDPQRPRLLHYVALSPAAPSLESLQAAAAHDPDLQLLVQELASHWINLLPGFQRLTLAEGQVLLTLCIGELQPLLRAQQFLADAVILFNDGNIWTVKALARCCRRGTLLTSTWTSAALQADLTQCGFTLDMQPTDLPTGSLRGQFNPRWQLKGSRQTTAPLAAKVASCTVVGAGLSGASVAAALAQRGWQVRVLDQGEAPAAGASGLPVGLVLPHVSADDCPLSRLTRSGVRLTLQQAQRLLRPGLDWAASGTLEHRVDGTLWHAQAAWLKPAELVRALLSQPGIQFQGGVHVTALRQCGDLWELLDAQGKILSCTRRVVFANAQGVRPLLAGLQASQPDGAPQLKQLPALHGVRGQMSWGWHADLPEAVFPPFPVNGAGSVISQVPVPQAAGESKTAKAWFVGASYEPADALPVPEQENHAANLARLKTLLPTLAQVLAPEFQAGRINSWHSTRCVTADRLPVVGPLDHLPASSLWICAGMGSRGLTFAVLCAELLAARWGAEPLPVEAALAAALNALRSKAP